MNFNIARLISISVSVSETSKLLPKTSEINGSLKKEDKEYVEAGLLIKTAPDNYSFGSSPYSLDFAKSENSPNMLIILIILVVINSKSPLFFVSICNSMDFVI